MPDFRVGATLDCDFDTVAAGAMTTLAGTPSLAVYKGNGTTESTAGVTLSVDFDGKTGSHHVRIDTTADAGFYATASAFTVRIAAGTVNGVSVVGRCVYAFTLEAQTVFSVYTSLQALITTVGVAGAGLTATAAAVWSVATRLLTAGTNIVLAKGVGVTGFNDLSAAQVNAEADTALADYDPPTRAELTTDTNSILSKLLKYVQLVLRKDAAIATDNATEVTAVNADGGSGTGAFANTTDSQEALRDRGDAAWGTATGFSTHSAADVWAVGSRTLTSFGTLVADVATAVWASAARTLTAFDASFKTGYALSSAGVQAIWDALTSALTTVNSIGKLFVDNLNATISSRATPAQVNTEVDTALADARLDELLSADSDIDGAAPPTVGSVFHELLTKTAGSFTYDQTTDSLEAVRDRGDAAWIESGPSAAAIASQVRTELTTELGRVDTTVSSRASQTSVDDLPTNAELASALAAADDAVLAAIAALNNLSQANVRTALGLASANLDTQLDALPTNAELATALGTADDAILAAIAALNNLSQANIRTAVGLASANLDTQLAALFTTALTESYAADGAAPSVAQALLMIQQRLTEFAIASTTVTIKKIDGIATAATLTLDSSTAPTSSTRAT